MSDREPSWPFETLDPPPGGLAGLRSRIRRERRKQVRSRALAAAAASIVVAGLAVLPFLSVGEPPAPLPGLKSDLLAVQLGLVDPPEETVSIRPDLRRQYAVLEIPTENEQVVFYLVGSR